MENEERTSYWHAFATIVLLAVAAAIRFRALDTTLFEDEVWVARLVRDGGLAPHTYNVPPLFYAIGRVWASLRGVSDIALREPAAFFGVVLCAIPLLAPRPWRVRLIWSVLLAFSSPLLFYSSRLKQYTLDACIVTALIVLFLHALERDRAWLWIAFFALAVASVMTLHSPVFLVAAAGVVALVKARRPWILAGFAIAAAAFAVAWLAYMAPGPTTPLLHGDMEQWFTQTGRWVDSPGSFLRNTMHWLGQAFNLVRFWWIVVPPLVLWSAIRARAWVGLALAVLPPMAILIASILHRYPYGEVRLMILCFPALYLITAEAIAEAARRVPLVLLVLAPFIFNGAASDTYNRTYMHIDDLRPLLNAVIRNHRPGELVFADPSWAAPLHYYAPELRPDLHPVIVTAPSGPGWYVQRGSRFTAPATSFAVRIGDTVAVHVP